MVLGRDTFAGDLLARLGVRNVYAGARRALPADPARRAERGRGAELVVLPDEPYRFTADDGPEAFPGLPAALVNGRHLTWYGPSLAEAPQCWARRCAPAARRLTSPRERSAAAARARAHAATSSAYSADGEPGERVQTGVPGQRRPRP